MNLDFLTARPRPPSSDTWLSPAETTERLKGYVSTLTHAALLLAKWSIVVPEIEIKILLADHLHRDVVITRRLIERITSMGVKSQESVSDAGYPHDDLRRAAITDGSAAKLFVMYQFLKTRLREEMLEHAAHTHPVWDEPTLRLVSESAEDLAQQINEVDRLYEALCAIFPAAFHGRLHDTAWNNFAPAPSEFDLTLPDLPARDERFENCAASVPVSEQMDSEEATLALMHANLIGVEITTIEACSRLIIEFPEMPWEFVADMARQCWDESRHAVSFYARFVELGGRLGQFPITHKLWKMASGQPAVVRLGLHQCIGEWTGVDGALWHAERFLSKGDVVTSRLFAFVAVDEITHVGFGNRWIKYLVGEGEGFVEAQQQARRRRAEFGESGDEPPAFPFNRWACELSGFPQEMVDALETKFEQDGSRFH